MWSVTVIPRRLATFRPAAAAQAVGKRLACGRRMTIDDELRPMPRGPSTTRDLERYAGLFATRTRGMKSSAMRDLMAVIARPEVISLAGGPPPTGAVPSSPLAAGGGGAPRAGPPRGG